VPEGVSDPRRHPGDAGRRGGALDPEHVTAVILAGGQGTRLRPLTLTRPKPIVPLQNVPFLAYQLAMLRRHGIRDVVLSCSYMVDAVERAMGDGRRWDVELRYAVEREPLGTGGGVRNAAHLAAELVVVLNGDVLTDLDLTAMLRFHRERRSVATIYLTRVADPTAYGLVELEADGRVRRFVEKPGPGEVTTDTINAGAYALDRSLLARIPTDRAVSIEREFFPALLHDRLPFHGWVADHYWLDIGSPAKYRQGQLDLLAGRVATDLTPPGFRVDGRWLDAGVELDPSAIVAPPAVIGAGSRLGPGSRVGPATVLGERCVVGAEAAVAGAVLWEDVSVGAGARLVDCIVGAGARIGARARVGAGVVLESGAVVDEGASLQGEQ
jgi:mannose-1-phosphate guanylyltransferase